MKILIAFALLFICVSAHASRTGNDLLAECKVSVKLADDKNAPATNSQMMGANHCAGLVEGVMDTVALWSEMNKSQKYSTEHCACILNGVTPEQAIRIVVKYLEDNPNLLHMSDSGLIALALVNAFPCKA